MRFAKITEAIIARLDELTGEELRLYILIVFHTFLDTGLCRKNITEIARIHKLVRNHASERFKSLRQKGWCRRERGGLIRPIVGFKSPENGHIEVQKTDSKSPENGHSKSQKRTFETAKSPENGHSFIPYIEPFKAEPLQSPAAPPLAAAESNGHLSKFSLDECLRYAEVCKSKGEKIASVHALARSAYKTGELDAFIEATLYPETPEETPADDERAEALKLLQDVHDSGEDVGEYKHWYSEEDWRWLLMQLAK